MGLGGRGEFQVTLYFQILMIFHCDLQIYVVKKGGNCRYLTFYQIKKNVLSLSFVLQIQEIMSKIPMIKIIFIRHRLDTMSLFLRAKKDIFFVLSLNFSHSGI